MPGKLYAGASQSENRGSKDRKGPEPEPLDIKSGKPKVRYHCDRPCCRKTGSHAGCCAGYLREETRIDMLTLIFNLRLKFTDLKYMEVQILK